MDNNRDQDNQELTDRSNFIKTDRDDLPTVTSRSPSPDRMQVYSANSSSMMWKDEPLSNQKDVPVIPKIFVTRKSQEATTLNKRCNDE